jgi:16S rRNA (uracil1498-N3)-methyltransferase
MECLYAASLEPGQGQYVLRVAEELRHLRALRLRPGESIALTNGRGLVVKAILERLEHGGQAAVFRILQEVPTVEFPIALAVAVLHERERLEFAVEKAVELGVREIVLVRTRYTQPCQVRLPRLQAKVLAAVKQAHRAWMPLLRGPMELEECCREVFPRYPFRVVADISGATPAMGAVAPVVVLVGPEGGWAAEELELLRQHGAQVWALGQRRLRSETAALVGLSLVGYLLELAQRGT